MLEKLEIPGHDITKMRVRELKKMLNTYFKHLRGGGAIHISLKVLKVLFLKEPIFKSEKANFFLMHIS